MVIELNTPPDILAICRFVGLIGVALYVVGYFCLCLGKLDSRKPLYFGMVFTAASCVLVSLWADFNLSAALIQSFYIVMSLGGILVRRIRPTPSPLREVG